MPDQGRTTTRTTARKTTPPVVDDARSTGTADRTDASPVEPVRLTPVVPTLPEPSPRTGVLVNVDAVRVAFVTGEASQTVGYLQHVLRTRGLDTGEPTGIADHRTRAAVAKFQASINEPPTGLPTDRTLDYLGFDVT